MADIYRNDLKTGFGKGNGLKTASGTQVHCDTGKHGLYSVITEKISIFFQFQFGSPKDPGIIGSQQVVIVRFDVGHLVNSP